MKQEGLYLGVGSFFLIAFAYFLQTKMLLTADVAYLIHVSSQVMDGGTYVSDFFETNPPMILYIYMPVVIALKKFPISIWYALHSYIFLLASLSSFTCYLLLKRIFCRSEERIYVYSFLLAIIFVLFYLPANQFGQREHILMMVMLPYIFSTALLLENKPINCYAAFLLSLFMAIGIALKPYFLVSLVLMECYFIYLKRSFFGWLRLESIVILSVFILYLYSIFIFHPNYFKILFPIISALYFIGFSQSMISVLINFAMFYVILALIMYFFLRKQDKKRHLSTLICLSMIGMVFAYAIPRMAWYYHVFPAFGFATILVTYYFTNFVQSIVNTYDNKLIFCRDIFVSIMLAIMLFAMPIYIDAYCFLFFIHEKNYGWRQKIIHYIASLPGKNSLTCMSVFSTTCFPLIYDSHADISALGRFPFFWWLKGVLKYQYEIPYSKTPTMIATYKKYIINLFTHDIKHNKPTFIVINTEDLEYAVTKKFDYINFLSTDKDFREEWKNYHLLKTIAYYKIYQRNTKD